MKAEEKLKDLKLQLIKSRAEARGMGFNPKRQTPTKKIMNLRKGIARLLTKKE